jgi:hypothetical protein
VVELLEAGPLVVGLETACWHSVLIRVLVWYAFDVLYNRHDVCPLLPNLGFSCQKARGVSAHLDAAKRLAWRQDNWPAIFRTAQRCKGRSLCAEEASFAQWGSLSSTWAKRGQQPEGHTCGKRKGYQGYDALEYCSGRLFSQGIAGRCNTERYQAFLERIMAHTTASRFFIHAGAKSHTRQAPKQWMDAHRARSTVEPLPSYSPDDNPSAYLWKKTQQRATHHNYF